MNKILFLIRKFSSLLNPQPEAGGLEMGANLLRLIFVRGKKLVSASLRLPPGVIEDGRVKNKEVLKSALVDLHKKIAPLGKKLYVIVDIPDNNIYTNVFKLPAAPSGRLEEAVNLNLRVVSPVDYDEVYADWQKLGSGPEDQIEILSAFASKPAVDEYGEVLESANFMIVAVEWSGLALSRLIESVVETVPSSLVLIRLSCDGMAFFILRAGLLYFSHFVRWPSSQVPVSVFEENIREETRRVLNFYGTHWSAPLGAIAYLIPSQGIANIAEKVLETFSLPVIPLRDIISSAAIADIKNTDERLIVALGSAMRGYLYRGNDTMISLAASGTEEKFKKQEIFNFLRIWRTIAASVLLFFVAVFAGMDAFILNYEKPLEERLAKIEDASEVEELNSLQSNQAQINSAISLALRAKNEQRSPLPLLRKVNTAAVSGISIVGIALQSEDSGVLLKAMASDETSITVFKDNLSKDSFFANVDLPLGNITKTLDGQIDFILVLNLVPGALFVPAAASAVPSLPAPGP